MPKAILIADHNPPFTGEDFHEGGVGGNPAAVVMLAEGFVELGFEVIVYTNDGSQATCRGVVYRPVKSLKYENCDVAILFRLWSEAAGHVSANRRLYFITDYPIYDSTQIHLEKLFQQALEWCSELRFMSIFQMKKLREEIRFLFERPSAVSGLPVCLSDYEVMTIPREKALLYCSVPNRGLYYLEKLFRRIKRSVGGAELWITSDFSLWGGASGKEEYEHLFERLEGVRYFGALPRPELVKLQNKARVMAYPCVFPEGFCISAAECMAAGAVPVTTDRFALTTTVGDGGILLAGYPGQFFYDWRFVRASIRLLTDDAWWESSAVKARERALRLFSPKTVAERMLSGENQPI